MCVRETDYKKVLRFSCFLCFLIDNILQIRYNCYDIGDVYPFMDSPVPAHADLEISVNVQPLCTVLYTDGALNCWESAPGSFLFAAPDGRDVCMARRSKHADIPDLDTIEAELRRVKYKDRYRSALKGTVYTLLVVAAIAILVATLWLPFLRIYGTSMAPTLQDGQIICCLKTSDFETGDIVAFYYNNKLLVKRVIGQPGDWVNMDAEGNVYVNDVLLEEPYLADKVLGDGDVEFPYQVPDGKLFVLGDHRSTSVDSRHSTVGCIAQEQIVGRIFIRIWPLKDILIFE